MKKEIVFSKDQKDFIESLLKTNYNSVSEIYGKFNKKYPNFITYQSFNYKIRNKYNVKKSKVGSKQKYSDKVLNETKLLYELGLSYREISNVLLNTYNININENSLTNFITRAYNNRRLGGIIPKEKQRIREENRFKNVLNNHEYKEYIKYLFSFNYSIKKVIIKFRDRYPEVSGPQIRELIKTLDLDKSRGSIKKDKFTLNLIIQLYNSGLGEAKIKKVLEKDYNIIISIGQVGSTLNLNRDKLKRRKKVKPPNKKEFTKKEIEFISDLTKLPEISKNKIWKIYNENFPNRMSDTTFFALLKENNIIIRNRREINGRKSNS